MRSHSMSTPVSRPPKPSIHFYPDLTDELLKSGKYDIPFKLTYTDTMNAIREMEDDIHTIQMVFATPDTDKIYDCYVHYLDPKTNTQKIGLIGFGTAGIIIREWV